MLRTTHTHTHTLRWWLLSCLNSKSNFQIDTYNTKHSTNSTLLYSYSCSNSCFFFISLITCQHQLLNHKLWFMAPNLNRIEWMMMKGKKGEKKNYWKSMHTTSSILLLLLSHHLRLSVQQSVKIVLSSISQIFHLLVAQLEAKVKIYYGVINQPLSF